MRAIDTNVLVRWLVEDDLPQAERVGVLLERARREGDSLFVSDLALCEMVWVLRSSYGFPRRAVSEVLALVLASEPLVFSHAEGLARALAAYEVGRGDFADYVMREQARLVECTSLLTFDRALWKEDGFEPP